jgi:hypothetical protein
VEVEDPGPGFAEDDLERANALLADPPGIGLVAGDGLGILVVAQLAARHGITVSLRSSLVGGTAAIVLLPHAILVTGEVRDTIVDGSLPRIDAMMPPPAELVASSVPPILPQQETEPAAEQPVGPDGPNVPTQPAVTAPAVPAAENTAPWHWLTASQPARTSAPEPPSGPADESRDPSDSGTRTPLPRRIRRAAPQIRRGDTGDSGAPAPLPRRIRRTAPEVERGVAPAAATGGPDQAPAHEPAHAAGPPDAADAMSAAAAADHDPAEESGAGVAD